MPVAIVFQNLKAGANIEEIMEWFGGLDREQGKAASSRRTPKKSEKANAAELWSCPPPRPRPS